jgi:hypothetical protein
MKMAITAFMAKISQKIEPGSSRIKDLRLRLMQDTPIFDSGRISIAIFTC